MSEMRKSFMCYWEGYSLLLAYALLTHQLFHLSQEGKLFFVILTFFCVCVHKTGGWECSVVSVNCLYCFFVFFAFLFLL